jgi:Ca2+-binding EF-hand superfamily protein
MKYIGVNELKKYLKDMGAKELQEEIVNLFKSFHLLEIDLA